MEEKLQALADMGMSQTKWSEAKLLFEKLMYAVIYDAEWVLSVRIPDFSVSCEKWTFSCGFGFRVYFRV